MTTSHLIHSSQALTKNALTKLNWIRVSHSILDLSIDILKNTFAYDNELFRNNSLFLTIFDLFKLTLYFVCEKELHQPLFEKCENLSELTKC